MNDPTLPNPAPSARGRLVRQLVLPGTGAADRRILVTEVTPPGRQPWLLLVACSRDAHVLERRRLAPYPPAWRQLADAELAAHWELATPMREPDPLPTSPDALAEELRVARAMLAAAAERERELLAALEERDAELAIADDQLRAFDRELQALEARIARRGDDRAAHPAA